MFCSILAFQSIEQSLRIIYISSRINNESLQLDKSE